VRYDIYIYVIRWLKVNETAYVAALSVFNKD
jgi:hypothetical protein